jgi:hypothetical protein
MAQNKQTGTGHTPPGSAAGGTGGSTKQTASTPTASQLVQSSWAASVDAQTAQQFTALTAVRQARTNQLQRQVTSLTKAYGASDPRTVAVQTSLTTQQTLATRLGMASATTSAPAPAAPANGWLVYGRVRNADSSPAPQLTVFLADESRAWLQKYAFAFTDQTGYFTLTYAPPAASGAPVEKKHRHAGEKETDKDCEKPPESTPGHVSAYLEVSNAGGQLMYIDATRMSISAGASVYRDILLSAEVPLGTPPSEPGAPAPVPPATK